MQVRFLITIEALAEHFQNWGDDATLEGLRVSAERTVQSWQVLLKEGATEPKILRATIKLKSITIPTLTEEAKQP